MNITLCCTDTKVEPWLQGLQSALPGADISVWQPGAPQADYAVVWAPPQQFLDEQPDLRALFNIGAGVDALLRLRIPPGCRVVRIDDGGMAVQMAEYVCHAVIRHFREFDGYAADIAQRHWTYRKPRARADFPVGVMGLGVLRGAGRFPRLVPRAGEPAAAHAGHARHPQPRHALAPAPGRLPDSFAPDRQPGRL